MALGSRLRARLTTATREAHAFAKQALLLRHDTGKSTLPDVRDGDDVVVLLHGLFASAGVLRPLRAALEEDTGVHTATLSYAPGPGVAELSARVADLCDQLPEGAHLHLVGHSLGGIVCRYFAQHSGDRRVVQTISLASPFAGVRGAALGGFGSVRDIAEGSPVLRALALGSSEPTVPHLSVVAGEDSFVRSPVAHALPGGDVVVMAGRGHNTLLFDADVAKLLAHRVRQHRRRAPR